MRLKIDRHDSKRISIYLDTEEVIVSPSAKSIANRVHIAYIQWDNRYADGSTGRSDVYGVFWWMDNTQWHEAKRFEDLELAIDHILKIMKVSREAVEDTKDLFVDKKGLYAKFQVKRFDNGDCIGGKHEDCPYFVLDLNCDPYAKDAIQAYASACELTHPNLAKDLREKAYYKLNKNTEI